MSQSITILNITPVGSSQYSVEFASDVALTDLFYEVSVDGSSWGSSIQLSNVLNPAIITIPNYINFNIRLSSNYTPPPPYSRIHSTVFTNTFN